MSSADATHILLIEENLGDGEMRAWEYWVSEKQCVSVVEQLRKGEQPWVFFQDAEGVFMGMPAHALLYVECRQVSQEDREGLPATAKVLPIRGRKRVAE